MGGLGRLHGRYFSEVWRRVPCCRARLIKPAVLGKGLVVKSESGSLWSTSRASLMVAGFAS